MLKPVTLAAFLSLSAFADIPSEPSISAVTLKADNLNLVYALMTAPEEKISETKDKFPNKVITFRKIQREGYKLSDRRADGESKRALICFRAEKMGYSGFVDNKYDCRQIRAVNMELPVKVDDLLKVKLDTNPSAAR